MHTTWVPAKGGKETKTYRALTWVEVLYTGDSITLILTLWCSDFWPCFEEDTDIQRWWLSILPDTFSKSILCIGNCNLITFSWPSRGRATVQTQFGWKPEFPLFCWPSAVSVDLNCLLWALDFIQGLVRSASTTGHIIKKKKKIIT